MSCILYSPFNAVCVQQRACVCMYVRECKGGRGQKSLRPVNTMRELYVGECKGVCGL